MFVFLFCFVSACLYWMLEPGNLGTKTKPKNKQIEIENRKTNETNENENDD